MSNETNMTPDTTGATGGREKFTPAPWKSFGDIVGTEAEDGKIFNSICQVHPADLIEGDDGGIEDCVHGEITLGNSRLIAAAPELYDLLKQAGHIISEISIQTSTVPHFYDFLSKVEAALAKAKGGDGE